ncbi:MAG: NifU family protein [Bacteroidota bacterium]
MQEKTATSQSRKIKGLKQKLPWIWKQEIEKHLENIRPYLQADGGDVEFLNVTEDGVVTVRWVGRCAACPVSNVTMRSTVERMLKQSVSLVKRVVAVSGCD